MNIRLLSVVFAAVGSLALTACFITTTDGSSGAGGTGGSGATGPTTTNSSGSGMGGGTSTSTSTSTTASSSGSGGAGACQTCAEVITPPDGDLNMICATSSDIFNALNECVCGAGGMMGLCETECTDTTMACFAWGQLPDPCIMCRSNLCMNQFNTCANDIP